MRRMLDFSVLDDASAAWSGASIKMVRNHAGFIADGRLPLLWLVCVEDIRFH
jgi:hypothetical protein